MLQGFQSNPYRAVRISESRTVQERLPSERAHPAIEPMLQIQSFYRAVNALSVLRGHDPDRPPNLRKVTETT